MQHVHRQAHDRPLPDTQPRPGPALGQLILAEGRQPRIDALQLAYGTRQRPVQRHRLDRPGIGRLRQPELDQPLKSGNNHRIPDVRRQMPIQLPDRLGLHPLLQRHPHMHRQRHTQMRMAQIRRQADERLLPHRQMRQTPQMVPGPDREPGEHRIQRDQGISPSE
ncbi:hypothetical protein GCM10022248_85090 [Nonomuraea soli]